jgi:hypothetical protein
MGSTWVGSRLACKVLDMSEKLLTVANTLTSYELPLQIYVQVPGACTKIFFIVLTAEY